ncbi:MAG: hypothetical protein U5L45_18135 [Saprospiraceae bacterium]|nr:hypothetical protein [Saprospiraceae bacterium]
MLFIFRRSRKMNHLFSCRCARKMHMSKCLRKFYVWFQRTEKAPSVF